MKLQPLFLCVLAVAPVQAQTGNPAGVSPCQSDQLSATQDIKESDQVDGGLGHHAITIAIRNVSSVPCALQGIPMLTLADAADRSLQVKVCANCPDYLFPTQPAKEVRLQPNVSAWVVVAYNINDGAGECREAGSLSLFLPDREQILKIRLAGMRSCGPVDITPFLGQPLPAPI